MIKKHLSACSRNLCYRLPLKGKAEVAPIEPEVSFPRENQACRSAIAARKSDAGIGLLELSNRNGRRLGASQWIPQDQRLFEAVASDWFESSRQSS